METETAGMEPMFRLTGYWCEDDLFLMTVYAADGTSCFETGMYTNTTQLTETATALARIADQVGGGADIAFGRFGAGCAGGAVQARLAFDQRGRLYLTLRLQSEFREFAGAMAASDATLHLTVELGMLDNFVRQLRAMGECACDEALLEAGALF